MIDRVNTKGLGISYLFCKAFMHVLNFFIFLIDHIRAFQYFSPKKSVCNWLIWLVTFVNGSSKEDIKKVTYVKHSPLNVDDSAL